MSEAFTDLRDLYQEVILEHSRHPRHQHRLDPFDGAAKGDNPMCGDRVEVRVRLDGGRVAAAAFEARGCAISVASADLMADAVSGRTPAEVRDLSQRFRAMVRSGTCPDCDHMAALQPLAGVHEFKSRLKCATLPWDALEAALEQTKTGEAGHG
jgi:nitrogen fixation NifU-like protein